MELVANILITASILLATLNNVHTWWVGVVGCIAFGYVFFEAKLYADVVLQAFFVATGFIGWRDWVRGAAGRPLSVARTATGPLVAMFVAAIAATCAYGALLHFYTDAYAPFPDSVVLAFSVLAQFLLMRRRFETWWCWLVVNTVAVPLYASRGLNLTAVLYGAYWINAIVALVRWRKLLTRPT